MRRLAALAALAAVFAGCGDGGGKIEPEAKASGSPILNPGKAPTAPPAK